MTSSRPSLSTTPLMTISSAMAATSVRSTTAAHQVMQHVADRINFDTKQYSSKGLTEVVCQGSGAWPSSVDKGVKDRSDGGK